MKSKRSKACDISQKVKQRVFARDNERCIFCGSYTCMPNAHVIPRSKGGKGIEENVVCACIQCHHKMDQSSESTQYRETAINYVKKHYPNWTINNVTYSKYEKEHEEVTILDLELEKLPF